MHTRIRRFTAAFAIAGLALSLARPALAVTQSSGDIGAEASTVPMILDAAILRPLGLFTVAVGTCFYLFPVLPVMMVTRPTDMFKPLKPLVGYPVQFTFKDPLGYHPHHMYR
jgi:hypothetical protein